MRVIRWEAARVRVGGGCPAMTLLLGRRRRGTSNVKVERCVARL
eukprot:CAMPEP_0194750986 /NCGR_PEP_ID=MMETSP0323_2-20130528/5091_1 /TAXON_ID=2866 ORGANISM="Crypthecodinium cohnii, Strain Seligo" /NCGR_SAMPLE_ID=MMETSP0323_2 /ASSEMBLY_ACC=CAM_ASM_000346 /LENGTH=43 /DNA_ID= /DNA_START= /DNA_END= /DNA_ORIENTATION=